MKGIKFRARQDVPEGYVAARSRHAGGFVALPESLFGITEAAERFRATWDYLGAEFTDEGIDRLFGDDDFMEVLEDGAEGDVTGAAMDVQEERMGF